MRSSFPIRYAGALWRMLGEGAAPLVGLFALSLATGFVFLAHEVGEGGTSGWDKGILLAFRSADDARRLLGPPWLHEAARDITSLGSFAVLWLISFLVLVYLAILRQYAAALLILVSSIGGVLLSTLLKIGFDRARPDLVPHEAVTFTASFPSGHAMMTAVTYLTLGALLARVQTRRRERFFVIGAAIGLAVLVGATRVYLGVHWPSDVLAGWCIGAAWSLACWLVLARTKPSAPANP